MRDIFRDAVKPDREPERGLGTEIASLFRGKRLKGEEEIQELRGFKPQNPFNE